MSLIRTPYGILIITTIVIEIILTKIRNQKSDLFDAPRQLAAAAQGQIGAKRHLMLLVHCSYILCHNSRCWDNVLLIQYALQTIVVQSNTFNATGTKFCVHTSHLQLLCSVLACYTAAGVPVLCTWCISAQLCQAALRIPRLL